jgi:hypothetical protein
MSVSTMFAAQPLFSRRIEVLLNRIKAEFDEMPGLRLTPWQAQRLWDLDETDCDAILTALVEAAFLRRTKNGSFARASDY